MGAWGFHRGHAIEFDQPNDVWRYSADGVAVPDDAERDCGHCGKSSTSEGHDGCLGTMPGVVNACCGHGRDDEAYVVTDTGNDVRGEAAMRAFRILGVGPCSVQ